MSFALSGSKQYLIRQSNTSHTEPTKLDLTAYSASETASPTSRARYGPGWSPRNAEKGTPRITGMHRPESKVSMTEFSQPKSTSVSTRLYRPTAKGPRNYIPGDPYESETKKLLNDFEGNLQP